MAVIVCRQEGEIYSPNPVDPHRKHKREGEDDEPRRRDAPGQTPGQPKSEIEPPRRDEDETDEEWYRGPRARR